MVSTMVPSSSEPLLQSAPVLRVSANGGRTVVWLSGEYDMATVSVLAEGLVAAIALDDADLVVDLTEVQFIDLANIGLLIRAREFLRPRFRHLTLRNPPRCAQRVLDVCGIGGLIDAAAPDSGRAVHPSAPALRSWVPVSPTGQSDPGRGQSSAVSG